MLPITNRNMKIPDLRHVRSFIAVVQSGSFSKAAETLFMTQPGVTAHVGKLEKTLGVKLLERYPRANVLTAPGQQFYAYALNLFDEMTDALEAMREETQQIGGWLRVAAPGSFAGYLLQHLARLQAQHPDLRLAVNYQPNEVILRELGAGRLDVGFVTHRPDDTNFLTEAIFQDQVVIVRRKKSGRAEKIRTEAELQQLVLIDYPDRPHLLDAWITHHFGKRRPRSNALDYRYFVNNLEAVIQLAAKGHGCAILPMSAIATHPLKSRLEVVAGANPAALKQTIYWTLRSNSYLSKRIKLLKQILSGELPAKA
jgi:DNA-binding transcriptional LysR family regulator